MPIRQFLHGEKFDGETTRVLGVAFELVCAALRVGDSDDVKQTIANKIIFLAKAGERRPDALCEQVLKEIRGQPGRSGPCRAVVGALRGTTLAPG